MTVSLSGWGSVYRSRPTLRRTMLSPHKDEARRTVMYTKALACARKDDFETAARHFEVLLQTYPALEKAWISYAQLWKRRARKHNDAEALEAARNILQKGLQENPTSGSIAQTWGLTELQAGHVHRAVRLLDRAVQLDPSMSAVLNWKPVKEARELAMQPKAKLEPAEMYANCR